MRFSTFITLAAIGFAGFYAYRLSADQKRLARAAALRAEPIVMWFETADERSAFCEGAD